MVMMTMVRVVRIEVTMVVVPIVAVRMMIVAIVMMIAVPSCGWSRAADCNCADNAYCRSDFS
jgi:hypothetical protein